MLVAGVVLAMGAVVGAGVLFIGRGATTNVPPSLRPVPSLGTADRVMASLWRVLEFGTLSYHVEVVGSATWGTPTITGTFTLSLDVRGDDYTGKAYAKPGAGHVLIIRKAGFLYAQIVGQKKWYAEATSLRELRQAPFLGIDDHGEIAYGGPFVEDGKTLHRLTSTAVYRPAIARMLNIDVRELPSATETLELIVSDEGVPIRATFSGDFEGDPITITPPFKGSATYRFSKFGETVTIRAPRI